MKSQDIYRIMYKFGGAVYQSTSYFKSKEKAMRIAKKDDDSRAVIWLRKQKKSEVLIYCFELAKEAI